MTTSENLTYTTQTTAGTISSTASLSSPAKLTTGVLSQDVSQVVSVPLGDKTIIDPRDIILGGDGNDTLQGGSGEDWIFGGPGNDVLCGGFDRQAGDLLWGGDGDDIFQVVTDQLPQTLAAQQRVGDAANVTYVPTYSDRFDGGAGNNEVLYLGGDLDPNGLPVPDNMAVRYNTVLHRWEITSRVWDYKTRQWMTVPQNTPAEIVSTVKGPTTGVLAADETLALWSMAPLRACRRLPKPRRSSTRAWINLCSRSTRPWSMPAWATRLWPPTATATWSC